MIRIDVCSDLHVDHHEITNAMLENWGIDPATQPVIPLFNFNAHRNMGSNIVVIAGDISDHLEQVEEVIDLALATYEYVVYVDGNHEHVPNGQPKDVQSTMDRLTEMSQDKPNFVYLDGINSRRWDYNGVAFIGGNGWYDWKAYEDRGITMPMAFASWDDHARDANIDFGEFGYPNTLAAIQAVNLSEEMERISRDNSIKSVVLVTHTSPFVNVLRWHPTDNSHNAGTASFCNTEMAKVLDRDHGKKIKLAIYGHTHDRKTTQIDHVVAVNNAYGYPSESSVGTWFMANFEVENG